MNREHIKTRIFSVIAIIGIAFFLAACGGGAGTVVVDPDADNDGIPDVDDSFPSDANIFASFISPAVSLQALFQGSFCIPLDISNNGEVVGFSEIQPGSPVVAVQWVVEADGFSNGFPIQLNPVSGMSFIDFSTARSVNDFGQIAGEAEVNLAGDLAAVLWNDIFSPAEPLPLLGAPGTFSAAFDINNNGQIVGDAENNFLQVQAVIWTNELGAVVGEAVDSAGVIHAVLWEPNTVGGFNIIDLGFPEDFGSRALSINENNEVVGEVEVALGEIHAAHWVLQGTILTRTDLGITGFDSSANDIDDSNRVVGFANITGTDLAAVWDTRSIDFSNFNLILDGLAFSQANSINSLGQVVGRLGSIGFAATPE
jgi:uncharacterized membrane protein